MEKKKKKKKRQASEDVLVVMATRPSGKTEQMRRRRVIPSHARVLSVVHGDAALFSPTAFLSSPPFPSSFLPPSRSGTSLKISLLVHLPIFPASCTVCRAPPAESCLCFQLVQLIFFFLPLFLWRSLEISSPR